MSSEHLSRGKRRPFQRPWSRPFLFCWEARCCPLVAGRQGVFRGLGGPPCPWNSSFEFSG